jgi:nucleotide-binding universal stress UspA family protein
LSHEALTQISEDTLKNIAEFEQRRLCQNAVTTAYTVKTPEGRERRGMIRLKRILVPTDFSESANRALAYGCELADKFDAEIHVLFVVKESVPYHGYDWEPEDEVAEQLASLPGTPWDKTLRVERNVRVGPPFFEIITEARDKDVDLIVMGTHGYGPIKHMLIGSVAERVVRQAPCPVLTICPAGFQTSPNLLTSRRSQP